MTSWDMLALFGDFFRGLRRKSLKKKFEGGRDEI